MQHRPEAKDAWQSAVDDRFDREAQRWDDAYHTRVNVRDEAHRARLRLATGMLHRVCPPGARILDLGCGAGLASVVLARAGNMVTAADHLQSMLDATTRSAGEAGVADRVTTRLVDAHHLPFAPDAFDAILALGLLQWSHSPHRVIAEMARVVGPGGHVIVNATNAYQLAVLIDPYRATLGTIRPLRNLRQRLWRRSSHNLHGRSQLLAMLRSEGLLPMRQGAVGYGPFTLLARPVIPDSLGRWAQRRLERWARRIPVIRRTAAQLVVLAVKQVAV